MGFSRLSFAKIYGKIYKTIIKGEIKNVQFSINRHPKHRGLAVTNIVSYSDTQFEILMKYMWHYAPRFCLYIFYSPIAFLPTNTNCENLWSLTFVR